MSQTLYAHMNKKKENSIITVYLKLIINVSLNILTEHCIHYQTYIIYNIYIWLRNLVVLKKKTLQNMIKLKYTIMRIMLQH
jgi:hypothetical protein